MASVTSLIGCTGVLSNICSHLKVCELAALERTGVGADGLISTSSWALSATYEVRSRFVFPKDAVEIFSKEDAKFIARSLKAIWVSKQRAERADGMMPRFNPVVAPDAGASKKLLTALAQAQKKAAVHLESGGKVAKVFVARFLFEAEHLKKMSELLAQKQATAEAGQRSDDDIPCCKSYTAVLPLAALPPRHRRGRNVPWQVPAVCCKMAWAGGWFWLEQCIPPLGEYHYDGLSSGLVADVSSVSQHVTLRMNSTTLAMDKAEKGVGLCAVTNLKGMYADMSSEGLTTVLFIRDQAPTPETPPSGLSISRDVHALQITYSEAYNRKLM